MVRGRRMDCGNRAGICESASTRVHLGDLRCWSSQCEIQCWHDGCCWASSLYSVRQARLLPSVLPYSLLWYEFGSTDCGNRAGSLSGARRLAQQQQLGDEVFGRLHVHKIANLGMILEHNTEHRAAMAYKAWAKGLHMHKFANLVCWQTLDEGTVVGIYASLLSLIQSTSISCEDTKAWIPATVQVCRACLRYFELCEARLSPSIPLVSFFS